MAGLIRFSLLITSLALLLVGYQERDRLTRWLAPLAPTPPTQPLVGGTVQSQTTAQMETAVQQQINVIRQQQGLSTLRTNEPLAAVARNYSRQMATQNFFAHVSPQGETLSDRVQAAKIFYFTVGENLFTSTNIPQPTNAAIAGWMNSPGHRENILRPEYRETGVGVWRTGNTYYFTQLFMRSL